MKIPVNFIAMVMGLIAAPLVAATEADAARGVNEQLRAAWVKEGLTAAPRSEDATFLRRVSLDLTGTLPTADEVVKFVADADATKRGKVVERLLTSDAYARHWGDYWDALLMGRLTREGYIDRNAFHQWLVDQFATNVPWDKFVYSLLTAEGYNTNKVPGNAASNPPDQQQKFNAATNWFLRYRMALPELAGTTSRVFLGVQIQCAQCHDHKTEAWKKDDFKQFTAFFTKTWPTYYDKGMIIGTTRQETKDWPVVAPINAKTERYFTSYKEYVESKPRFLQGEEYRGFTSRRAALAKWVTAKENPWFAKAIVNRMWAKMTGRGFVEPIDDLRPGNPAVMNQTLELLANDFIANGYDLHHLLRTICATEAYQLACRADAATVAEGHPKLWSAYPMKRLELETQLDVMLQATGAREALNRLTKSNLRLIRQSILKQFVTQLGTDDMAEATSFDETVPQALLLLNGTLVNGATRATPGLALAEVLKSTTDTRARIERLYLRTVSRRPTEKELAGWEAFLKEPREVVSKEAPGGEPLVGPAANRVTPEVANAPADMEFKELLKFIKTSGDYTALRGRVRNNADGLLFVKAFEQYSADYPLAVLASMGGGTTVEEQAFEDLFFALVNGSEFLTNH